MFHKTKNLKNRDSFKLTKKEFKFIEFFTKVV